MLKRFAGIEIVDAFLLLFITPGCPMRVTILGCPFIAAKGKARIFSFSLFGRHDLKGGCSNFRRVKLTQMSITNCLETYHLVVGVIFGCYDL